ncbi:unnamed protein product [Anisakis simplex]|uniref:Uncharacterized protein n=1 Tax=Anisakis simplex TaxID=6269 RepID=A0A0M3JJK5_ANISI|nr:unnamed protein product [Anisakis simplex]
MAMDSSCQVGEWTWIRAFGQLMKLCDGGNLQANGLHSTIRFHWTGRRIRYNSEESTGAVMEMETSWECHGAVEMSRLP